MESNAQIRSQNAASYDDDHVSVYVCLYACMYAVYTCMYVVPNFDLYVYMCVHMSVCMMVVCICIYECICMYDMYVPVVPPRSFLAFAL